MSIAHVIEETHDATDGVKFLTDTRSDWENSAFGNHITWHLALHYFGESLATYYTCRTVDTSASDPVLACRFIVELT